MRSTSASFVDRVPALVDAVVRATEGYEFTTFLIGSRLPESLDSVSAPEAKKALHAALWASLRERWVDRLTDFEDPELRILVDVERATASVSPAPVWIAGRYRKLDRELPQSRWPCRCCRGAGCRHCLGTGKTYLESVEEAIAGPALAACEGSRTRFHAVGREDVDARMLGTGRPFVLEVVSPRRRRLRTDAIEASVNDAWRGRMSVSGLRLGNAGDVERAKTRACEKSYRAVVAAARALDASDAERVRDLAGAEISQDTPSRVLHRRSDLKRGRRVFRADATCLRGGLLDARFRVESGTYVKELVSGDSGRTRPSVAALLGCACRVLVLDVLAVHDEAEAPWP